MIQPLFKINMLNLLLHPPTMSFSWYFLFSKNKWHIFPSPHTWNFRPGCNDGNAGGDIRALQGRVKHRGQSTCLLVIHCHLIVTVMVQIRNGPENPHVLTEGLWESDCCGGLFYRWFHPWWVQWLSVFLGDVAWLGEAGHWSHALKWHLSLLGSSFLFCFLDKLCEQFSCGKDPSPVVILCFSLPTMDWIFWNHKPKWTSSPLSAGYRVLYPSHENSD